MKSKHNLAGKIFGKLRVIQAAGQDAGRRKWWECICECGITKNIRQDALIGGRSKSCGCTQYDTVSKKLRTNARLVSAKCVYRGSYDDADITFEQFLELSRLNCHYCGFPPSNKFNQYARNGTTDIRQDWIDRAWFVYNGLDRTDSSKPHLLSNIVPCCIQCNKAKLTYTTDEFKSWITRVYDNIDNF